MPQTFLPVSIIIPTYNRAPVLKKALYMITLQTVQPVEIIVNDASDNSETEKLCFDLIPGLKSKLFYQKAKVRGAAPQRMQAIAIANELVIGFMDDDIYLEPDCLLNLWDGLNTDSSIGGVDALITNQQFHQLGRISWCFYRIFTSKMVLNNLEGKTIGPAINFVCSERNENKIIPVDWLRLGFALYKKEALPLPLFDSHFKGYSYMEDAALSFYVGRRWKLYTIKSAKVFHDSQPGLHKSNVQKLAEMKIVNRYYVMTKVLNKNSFKYKFQFLLFQLFYIVASKGILKVRVWKGSLKAVQRIFANTYK